jgi:polygalacturonase
MADPAKTSSSHPPFNVRRLGAAGDGRTLETTALQAAVDACHRQGGGMVFFPAGRYLTGTLFLHNEIHLHLDSGAVLLGSGNPEDYPVLDHRWEGTEQSTYAPLLAGRNLKNITVSGRGRIDGQGAAWWGRVKDRSLKFPRPRLISFSDCENILIEGLTLVNSPSWTINPVRCSNVTVRGVTIVNPPDSPNTDGINPDSCRHVRISDCYVSAGDDCITLKAGSEDEHPDRRAPCRDITIANCTLAHGHGGIVIGSEMNGGVQNVVISNCVFTGTDRGIRLKSRRGRGGIVEDIRASNLIMTDVLCPFTMNLYYGCGAWGDPVVSDKRPQPRNEGTPRIRRIHLSHITARGVKYTAGFFYGLPEMPAEEISLSDISVSLAAGTEAGYPEMADGLEQMQQAGFFLRNIRGLTLEHIEIDGQTGPAFRLFDIEGGRIGACGTVTPDPDSPVLHLNDVSNAMVNACRAAPGTGVFLRLEGSRTGGITLTGNDLRQARKAVEVAEDVSPGSVEPDLRGVK